LTKELIEQRQEADKRNGYAGTDNKLQAAMPKRSLYKMQNNISEWGHTSFSSSSTEIDPNEWSICEMWVKHNKRQGIVCVDDSDCLNGGTCNDKNKCDCVGDWYGDFCHIVSHLCDGVVCDPGVACDPELGTCSIPVHISPCDSNPCFRGHQKCKEGEYGSYECYCEDGWSGSDCSIEGSSDDGNDPDDGGLSTTTIIFIVIACVIGKFYAYADTYEHF